MSSIANAFSVIAGLFTTFSIALPGFTPSQPDVIVPLPPPPHVSLDASYTAKSILLADIRGSWRTAERASDVAHPIASITKVMTGLVALEMMPPTTPIVISQEAIETPGEVGDFSAGEVFTLRDALHAMMMSSSNDIAVAIAETGGARLGGKTFDEKIGLFVGKMNERALHLGMRRTIYRNPTGLDDESGAPSNLSTANDLLLLIRATQDTPLLWEASHDAYYTIFSFEQRPHVLFNLNELAGAVVNFIGSKTGTTDAAGESIVVIYEGLLGRPQALVLLGASPGERMREVSALLQQAGGMLP